MFFKNFMKEALNEAKKAFIAEEVPVGALLVLNNSIITRNHNRVKQNNNPLAHAEILVLLEAMEKLKSNFLTSCDLYVTLEPCNFCAAALSLARVRRVFWGASDEKFGALENNSSLYNGCKGLFHIPENYGGFNEKESLDLMRKFFLDKRHGAQRRN
jgi:tRNA(adenine34) deaminase